MDLNDRSAALQEIASTSETAQKIADDGPPEGADVPRLLAGLIAHLAEQVERLARPVAPPTPSNVAEGADKITSQQIADAFGEEDVSHEDAPAVLARDPNPDRG